MMQIFIIVFWISTALIFYSFLIYPLIIKAIARKIPDVKPQEVDNDLPQVTVLMAVHNEVKVILQKLENLRAQEYPSGKIRFLIGSDNSNDGTDEIIQSFCNKNEHFIGFALDKRRGKQGTVNLLAREAIKLHEESSNHIFVITDANVFLNNDAILWIARYYSLPKIGMVDTFMFNTDVKPDGISESEKFYIHNEVTYKHAESKIWGKMMGPFGGCFSIRSDLFEPVPESFLVDDFFLCMKVLEKNYKAINASEAKAYEGLPGKMLEEFRRKSRIAAGNYQNLFHFKHLLKPSYHPTGFIFFSHKIIRWFTWLLILLAVVSLGILSIGYPNYLYNLLFYLALIILIFVPILDYLLAKAGINMVLVRSVRYFIFMNIAFIKGFIRYVKGIRKGIWEPTLRS